MIRMWWPLWWWIPVFLPGCQSPPDNLRVAAAANTQYAIAEIIADFEEQTGIPCDLILGSSGKLAAKIRQGAPYHIFVSADEKYPEAVCASGRCAGVPQVYATGSLVMWKIDPLVPLHPDSLIQPLVDRIALANPRTAPYGEAAVQYLENKGLLESLEEKLVYGESLMQTNQFVVAKAADIAFTALSSVLGQPDERRGKWIEIDTTFYQPIAQSAVLIRSDSIHVNNSRKFLEFLFSEQARKILSKHGYKIPDH
jgi:molybdate transport system substrate-binding protein